MEESKPKEGHKGHSQHRTGFGCLAPECEFSGTPLNHVGALPAISRNPIILDRTDHSFNRLPLDGHYLPPRTRLRWVPLSFVFLDMWKCIC